MRVVVTCAFPQPGYELPHRILEATGLVVPARSHARGVTPASLHEQIARTDHPDALASLATVSIQQITPGRTWQALAADLFLGNASGQVWGWADYRVVHLLEFWRNFDPQIAFILAYDSPAAAVGATLSGHPTTGDDVTRTLDLWHEFNSELLRFSYANRERCLLANLAAVRQAPQAFAEQVARYFDLDLSLERAAAPTDDSRPAGSRLLECLAQELVPERDEARAVFEELESTADLPLALTESPVASAWDDYTRVLAMHAATVEAQNRRLQALERETAELTAQRAEQERMLQTVTRERDEQTRLAGEHAARVTATNALWAARDAEVARLEEENDGLAKESQRCLLQLRQTQEGLEQCQLVLQKREVEFQALERARAELVSRNDDLEKRARNLAQWQQRHDSLGKENEILLLQLHKAQEDLERHYIENRQLLDTVQSQASRLLPVHDLLPTEVLYDLRREIDGDNWYYAEHDGRWAGPEACSTLRIPAMASGTYDIELCVVDTMEPEIVTDMTMTFNGRPIAVQTEQGKRYTRIVTAQVIVGDDDREPVWEFALRFPKLVSPAEHGSDDQRRLAIRVASLCVRVRDETAPWLRKRRPGSWWTFWQ